MNEIIIKDQEGRNRFDVTVYFDSNNFLRFYCKADDEIMFSRSEALELANGIYKLLGEPPIHNSNCCED